MMGRASPRRTRRSTDQGVSPGKLAYRALTNPLTLQRAFSDDRIAHIHDSALRVLEQLGIRTLHAGARRIFARAGARVDEGEQMVYLDRGLVTQALNRASSVVTLAGTAEERDVTLGGRHVAFIGVGGPPHVTDIDRGRRSGTTADMRNFLKLSQHFDVLHLTCANVEPQDAPLNLRHYVTTQSQIELTDKPPFVYARGSGQVRDCFEMLRLGQGLTEAEFRSRPRCYAVINTNSPRQLDGSMCQGLIDFAEAGQMTVVTPFTLAGAMAPVNIAAALTLQHAEALAGIALTQLVRAGAPVVYGSFTSNVDMKSGAPAFGTPAFVRAAFGSGQLARHIGLPWRGSAATSSNSPDAQSAYEYLNSLWAGLLGGVNMVIHAAGWLEGGLSASLEKFVLDIEMLQVMAELMIATDDDPGDLYEAIAEVEPGGHFFGAGQTMERFEHAFYAPLVSDGRNFGQWTEAGSKTATERANGIWKQVLNEFVAPRRDPAQSEAVAAFVARRTREGGELPS